MSHLFRSLVVDIIGHFLLSDGSFLVSEMVDIQFPVEVDNEPVMAGVNRHFFFVFVPLCINIIYKGHQAVEPSDHVIICELVNWIILKELH